MNVSVEPALTGPMAIWTMAEATIVPAIQALNFYIVFLTLTNIRN